MASGEVPSESVSTNDNENKSDNHDANDETTTANGTKRHDEESGKKIGESAVDDEKDKQSQTEKPLWGRLVSLNAKYKNVELREETTIIGRSASQCTVVVDSLAVSGKHCTILRQKNEYPAKGGAQIKVDYVVLIKDTSTNGTFVNGDTVGKNNTKLLFDGCEISLLPKKNATEKIAFVFQDCQKEEQEIEQGGPQRAYEMKKELGTGTFASVRLAVHRATGEEVAIKVIDKQKFLQKAKRKDALMDEVRVLTSVSHPNILQIKGVFETPTTLYLVLELATGGELFDRVAAGAQPEPTAKEIFHQILLAIKYLHAQGIAHRDLKPENILLQSADSNTIKISDFGLSRIIDEGTYMRTVCGTPQYVAPEILTKAEKEGYGKAVDMWSLGVILFVLLGGYAPFEDDPKAKVGAEPLFEKIKKAKYSFDQRYWKNISEDAKDLIKNLLVVDPTKRLTAEQALIHPWMAAYHEAISLNATSKTNGEVTASEDKPNATGSEVEHTTDLDPLGPCPSPISARRKRPLKSNDNDHAVSKKQGVVADEATTEEINKKAAKVKAAKRGKK